MRLPERLEWWRELPDGRAWLETLPRLVAELGELWSLRLGEPYPWSNASLAVPADRADGTRAVLKINFPERETEHEADALAHYRGRGAVRLLARDDERAALLVERCEPGTQLWEVSDDDEAVRVAAGILRRLWRPPTREHPFDLLADVAAGWAQQDPQLDAGLVRELVAGQGELVVCHQDFHGGNVLRAGREPWLAIDPKPLVGEREFDTASLVRDRRPIADVRVVARRLDLLSAELGLDRERMRLWGIVHAVAWRHPEVVRLLRRARP